MTEQKATELEKNLFAVPIHLHRFGHEFHEPFPQMSRPECIGFFSIDGERKYQDNADNLGYLHMPANLPLDLNAGIETVLRKKEEPLYYDMQMLCKYIYNHQGDLLKPFNGGKTGARCLDADFVALRGLLRLIMCLPYESSKEFRMHAVRMNNNIYMVKVETELQKLERQTMTPDNLKMCSWGFKFEQYLTSSKPTEKPKTDVPVNESEEFIAMFKCNFAGSELLYGAEMDCINASNEINLNDSKNLRSLRFVELKTIFQHMNCRQKRTFDQFKTFQWWSQSFLVGISSIYAGLRDDQGVVREIKEYEVSDLARNRPWTPNAMGVFLKEFLNQLKHVMETIDDPYTVVQLDYIPRLHNVFYTKIQNDARANEILPNWYRDLLSDMPRKRVKH